MTDFDTKAIKAAVAANRKKRRLYADILRRPRLQRSPALSKLRSNMEKHVAHVLANSGFSRKQLDGLHKQTQTELRRLAAAQKAEIVRHSASALKSTRWSLDEFRRFAQQEPLPTRLPPNLVIIDNPGLVFSQSEDLAGPAKIQPGNSFAKVRGEWNTPPTDRGTLSDLSFIFAWSNPRDVYILINAVSYLQLNGFCAAAAGGGLISNFTQLSVSANLEPFVYIPRNYPTPPYESDQLKEVAALFAATDGNFSLGDVESTGISGTYGMVYSQFAIPPRGTAIFEVRLELLHSIDDDGWIVADFASGAFQVACPGLFLVILS